MGALTVSHLSQVSRNRGTGMGPRSLNHLALSPQGDRGEFGPAWCGERSICLL